MQPALIKLAAHFGQKTPDSHPAVATAGKFSVGDELYRDKVDYTGQHDVKKNVGKGDARNKVKVKSAYERTKMEAGKGKFEDLVIDTLSTNDYNRSTPDQYAKTPPSYGRLP